MTKRIKLLMLAGTIGLFVILTGCDSPKTSNPPTTLNEASEDLEKEIDKLAGEVDKAAKDIEKIKNIRGEIQKTPDGKLSTISALVGANPQENESDYLTGLKSRPESLKKKLEAVKDKAKNQQTTGKSSTSTSTAWDSTYYVGAVLLAALLIGLLAGWGGGTLAAKRRLTKAGFW